MDLSPLNIDILWKRLQKWSDETSNEDPVESVYRAAWEPEDKLVHGDTRASLRVVSADPNGSIIQTLMEHYTMKDLVCHVDKCWDEKKLNYVSIVGKLEHVVKRADWEWLFGQLHTTDADGLQSTSEHVQEITNCLTVAIQKAKIPGFTDKDGHFDRDDFTGVSERSHACMNLCRTLLERLQFGDEETTLASNTMTAALAPICVDIVIVCAQHSQPFLWTTDKSIKASAMLLRYLLTAVKFDSVSQLLCGENVCGSVFSKGLAVPLFKQMRPLLSKDTWKKNPASCVVFRWCLLHIKMPLLSDFLDFVIPPSLLFVDDFQLEHKISGVKCLHHIIDNTSRSELSWYGRAEVIYSALEHQLYVHEADLIKVLIPCLSILAVVETSPKKANVPRSQGKYDKIFHMLLANAEMENQIVLRRAYTDHLPQFINKMGITVLRHFKRLLRVVFSYLEVYDGPDEISRLNILSALQELIKETWPRIPHHLDEIMKSLFKFLFDISSDKTLTPDHVKKQLLSNGADCVLLLKRVCPIETESQVKAVLNMNSSGDFLSETCVRLLQQVVNAN